MMIFVEILGFAAIIAFGVAGYFILASGDDPGLWPPPFCCHCCCQRCKDHI